MIWQLSEIVSALVWKVLFVNYWFRNFIFCMTHSNNFFRNPFWQIYSGRLEAYIDARYRVNTSRQLFSVLCWHRNAPITDPVLRVSDGHLCILSQRGNCADHWYFFWTKCWRNCRRWLKMPRRSCDVAAIVCERMTSYINSLNAWRSSVMQWLCNDITESALLNKLL